MKSKPKDATPALRSRGFIGAKPASTVSGGAAVAQGTGTATKSRGSISPKVGAAPSDMNQNTYPRGKYRLK
ncbi:hypothetical protein JET14_05650 [Martelella lutilitoris]|uniref:Uncharacterized protein n=1 Tax=Martelella lutilitoris TaxID=2583532 RepID=A0A7T7KN80_9HYPH|nr:hypothetical protein [Martelella lutilitoris]QQM31654.1 hypothetical protein JET14_05650 [Martelella lutilitoris]